MEDAYPSSDGLDGTVYWRALRDVVVVALRGLVTGPQVAARPVDGRIIRPSE